MKQASAQLDAHLQQEVTTLATCWRVTRTDGQQYQFTEHDRPLTCDLEDGTGAQEYSPSGSFNRSAIKTDAGMAVDTLEVVGVLDDASISEVDMRRGLFNHATIEVFLVNWADTSQGPLRMRKGWTGEISPTSRGFFRAELRGLAQALQQPAGELYGPICRANLGDGRCKLPIHPDVVQRSTVYAVGDYVRASNAPVPADSFDFDDRIYRCVAAGTTDAVQPAYDAGVGNQTVDGTATFEAEESWSRAFEVVAVDPASPRKKFTVTEFTPNSGGPRGGFPDDWFNLGTVTWEAGDNAGHSMEVRDFVADDGVTIQQTIELFLEVPFDIQVGDRGRVYPGCDLRRRTCIDKFDNILNRRAEDFIPNRDSFFSVGDAK